MIDDIVIGNALGIQDQPVNADVTLYPNPARDHICVSLNQPEIFVTDMALMNETGTILKEYPFNHMSGEILQHHFTHPFIRNLLSCYKFWNRKDRKESRSGELTLVLQYC